MLVDKFGRQITYLRLAVTDRCNLRCFYCMPECGIDFVPRSDLLSFEEIHRLALILVSEGINKLRITGGEPFVRKDLMILLRSLRGIKGLKTLSVTTNGTLTAPHIAELKALDVDVNLSLDSINPATNFTITRRNDLDKTLDCLEGLTHSGIKTKVNMVVMDGVNSDEIGEMAQLAINSPVVVRFLEEMPFNGQSRPVNSRWDHQRIAKQLLSEFSELKQVESKPGETAQLFTAPNWKGSLGIIASHSRTFCGTCNRLRITAKGELRTCLYSNEELSLRDVMRSTSDDRKVVEFIQAAIQKKAINGFEAERTVSGTARESMATIGG
ncbi:MAG: GTP 3',8-cyclase MoaA [Flavobacteriales bacterium]|nr:GTP 3',8-cyclase MoaA [Flavobacteriales bacterium]